MDLSNFIQTLLLKRYEFQKCLCNQEYIKLYNRCILHYTNDEFDDENELIFQKIEDFMLSATKDDIKTLKSHIKICFDNIRQVLIKKGIQIYKIHNAIRTSIYTIDNFKYQYNYAFELRRIGNVNYIKSSIPTNLNYDEFITIYEKMQAHPFIDTNSYEPDEQNLIIQNNDRLQRKYMQNMRYIHRNIIYIITNKERISICKTKRYNNDRLIYHIYNDDNIRSKLLMLSCEFSIEIFKHVLRFDIHGIVLCNNNILLEFVIEVDEHHHDKENYIWKYDFYKDYYALLHGISMLRIKVSKITLKEMNYALDWIKKIITDGKPNYDLPKIYKITKEKQLNNDDIPIETNYENVLLSSSNTLVISSLSEL